MVKLMMRSHHETYVVGNEVCCENLNRAAVKGAMGRIGSVVPRNRSGHVSLSLESYIWFGFWNNDLLTDSIRRKYR